MTRWERWSFGLLWLVVALTGGVYFWMKYFTESSDPFAVANHPWQPAMLNLHVLASPALLLVFGIILNSHVMKKLGGGSPANRRTGLLDLAAFGTMACSGYLLQVITNEALLRGMIVVHVGSGVIFSATYLAHLAISARLDRARRRAQVSEVA